MSKRRKSKRSSIKPQRKRRKTKTRIKPNSYHLLKPSGKKSITTEKISGKLLGPTPWNKPSNGPKTLQGPNLSTRKISNKTS
jgi:hypothetical protein